MPLVIEVPDEVLAALKLTPEDAARELRTELAVVLYERRALSAGKAAEMSGLSRWAFEDLLAKRRVVRNYSEEDLQHDLKWSSEQGASPLDRGNVDET
jgi:predicted HTH domain antitoxin